MFTSYHQRNTRQQGFVLIMALVLLAVLTLIGVSSMNSANMELKATANAQQHHVAFNAVQAVLEFAVSNGTTLDFQDTDPQILDTTTVGTALPDTHSLTATSVHAGCSVGVGSSLEEGKGLSYNFYTITADGFNRTSAGNRGLATSRQAQGVRFPAAACEL